MSLDAFITVPNGNSDEIITYKYMMFKEIFSRFDTFLLRNPLRVRRSL
jgi:hypothetical protein